MVVCCFFFFLFWVVSARQISHQKFQKEKKNLMGKKQSEKKNKLRRPETAMTSSNEYAHSPDFECPDGPKTECIGCGARDCPHGEPLHYHHDGCPACDLVRLPRQTTMPQCGCEDCISKGHPCKIALKSGETVCKHCANANEVNAKPQHLSGGFSQSKNRIAESRVRVKHPMSLKGTFWFDKYKGELVE
jgi:hypothetical protein